MIGFGLSEQKPNGGRGHCYILGLVRINRDYMI